MHAQFTHDYKSLRKAVREFMTSQKQTEVFKTKEDKTHAWNEIMSAFGEEPVKQHAR